MSGKIGFKCLSEDESVKREIYRAISLAATLGLLLKPDPYLPAPAFHRKQNYPLCMCVDV